MKGFTLSDIKVRRFTIIDRKPIIPIRMSLMDKIYAEEDKRIFEKLCRALRKNKKDLAFTFYFGIM